MRVSRLAVRSLLEGTSFLGAVQLCIAISVCGSAPDPSFAAERPFVICENQRYALCADASCFVYDGVAYCRCTVLRGDSISLQLGYASSAGERNVCGLDRQGKRNGYLVSTFSLPNNVRKGGPAAVYTCPGSANAGSGVAAPVAYGQCDGGICFTSSRAQRFPGFEARLRPREVMCSCPISTGATAGSSDGLGYQIFGPYHPDASIGSRCDASGCAACSVPNPSANGTTIPVGAPTGSAEFLTLRLDGAPLPELNQCLCACTQATAGSGSISCTVASDLGS